MSKEVITHGGKGKKKWHVDTMLHLWECEVCKGKKDLAEVDGHIYCPLCLLRRKDKK